jgi:hypothetical protein
MTPTKQSYTLARYRNSNRKQLRAVWARLKLDLTFSQFVKAVKEASRLEDESNKKGD